MSLKKMFMSHVVTLGISTAMLGCALEMDDSSEEPANELTLAAPAFDGLDLTLEHHSDGPPLATPLIPWTCGVKVRASTSGFSYALVSSVVHVDAAIGEDLRWVMTLRDQAGVARTTELSFRLDQTTFLPNGSRRSLSRSRLANPFDGTAWAHDDATGAHQESSTSFNLNFAQPGDHGAFFGYNLGLLDNKTGKAFTFRGQTVNGVALTCQLGPEI